ncbi:tyrosine-protein phosphatase [Ornithinibacillus contaminans]|uniref:tyrosine-protein phosphatase n=1 Tax=Ornithinibacillus contaminans TaxID=694055 RepID=UPI00064DC3E7|nr:CpsB/CapC family capsule biosynthesis tyrosine phosphatase [Ornithinibacillus contaminans]
MIDIHCHILPGIDDGPKTMVESLVMAQAAVKQGIHTIIATPHHQNGWYINTKKEIEQYIVNLNVSLQEENIPLTVLLGQETRLHANMIEELQTGVMVALNNTKYVFVEFPSGEVPSYSEQMLFDIQIAGYTPIIVHPERNSQIAEHPSILFNLVQRGALTQITAGSIVGSFGKAVQKLSHKLIESNLTHFIASDAHNTTTRKFLLQDAYKAVRSEHGTGVFYKFMENAQLLINGDSIQRDEPEMVRKRKRLGLF